MTENQTLREALQAIANIDDATNHSVDASAALDRIGQIARQALALPPDVPETTFRGMREALQLIAWSNDSKWQADCARQAIAMPTADHLPDAGKMVVDHFPDATKMIETAAPGCELERFEAWWRSVQLMTFPKEYDTKRLQDWGSIYKPKALEAWQARAALAGDAADAQRLDFLDALCSRPASSDMHMRNGSVALYVRTGIGAQLAAQGQGKVRDAIDAAMRKDKP